MPRIRTIKPEFPQSETVGSLSRDARLLFVQLWTISDDAGRTRAASRMLASLLYPYDDDAATLIDGWLDELEAKECIHRYEVDGAKYLEIVNWLKHQKIDRPSKSKIPDPIEPSRTLAKPREDAATDLGPRTKDQGAEGSRKSASNLRVRIVDCYLEFGCEPVPDTGRAEVWESQGYDPDLIVSVIRDGCQRKKVAKPLHYWEPAIREAHEKRAPKIEKPKPIDWATWVEKYQEKGLWANTLGPEPGYDGCRAPREVLEKHGYLKLQAAE